jgi:uncharacterized damage-inducible protein DinB
MDRLTRLQRLFRYDDWANRETLASLRKGVTTPKALRWLAHVIGAEKLWIERLNRSKPGAAVWPELSLERCGKELDEVGKLWDEFLGDLDPEGFEREIEYVNSKGERWSSTVGDVLNHVLLHSAYHRGQIAAEVRSAGGEPAYTDFIHAARRGILA